MWCLYTHDCHTLVWHVVTAVDWPDRGRLMVAPELKPIADHYYDLGFHIGLRYAHRVVEPGELMTDAAATMFRIVSIASSKPFWCTYTEPGERTP